MKPRTIIFFPLRLPIALCLVVVGAIALPKQGLSSYKAGLQEHWQWLKGERDI